MFERFTDRARRVLVLAQEEARLLNHSFIGTEHILLGLIHEGEGVAAKALESLGVSLEAVREKVEETIGLAGTAPTGSPPFTPRAKKVLELSLREALQLSDNYIGTGHVLLGLIRQGDNMAGRILGNLHVDLTDLRARVTREMAEHPEQSDEASAATRLCDASARRCHARASALELTTARQRSGRSLRVLRAMAFERSRSTSASTAYEGASTGTSARLHAATTIAAAVVSSRWRAIVDPRTIARSSRATRARVAGASGALTPAPTTSDGGSPGTP